MERHKCGFGEKQCREPYSLKLKYTFGDRSVIDLHCRLSDRPCLTVIHACAGQITFFHNSRFYIAQVEYRKLSEVYLQCRADDNLPE